MNLATNIWLWALTGRSGDFVDPELNSGVSFGAGASPETERIRDMLCLGDTRTDFHVLGALHAALSVSHFANLPQAPLTCACLASRPTIRPSTVTGAEAAPSATKRWPVIRNRPTRLPAPTTFSVSYDSPGVARVADDAGVTKLMAVRSSGHLVIVDGLLGVGIDASFLLDSGTWQEGDSFSVFCEPSRYPYSWVAGRLADSRDTWNFAAQWAGPLALENPDPFLRTGAVALAVMAEQLSRTSGLPVTLSLDAESGAQTVWTLADNQLALDGAGLTIDNNPICYDE